MGLFSSIGSIFGPVGSAVGSVLDSSGSSSGEPSRAREGDSYALQAKAVQDNILPLRKAYEAAGYHPLLAIGQQPFTPSGAVVGSSSSRWSDMGQSADRLVSTLQSGGERVYTREMQRLQIENMQAQNDLLRAQTTRIARPQVPPIGGNYAVPGQSGSGVVEMLPSEQVHSYPGDLPRQAGTINTYQVDATGGVVPSEQMKNRIDDDLIGSLLWHLKNRISRPDLPDGRSWNAVLQRYGSKRVIVRPGPRSPVGLYW